jgi:hypothetical protein
MKTKINNDPGSGGSPYMTNSLLDGMSPDKEAKELSFNQNIKVDLK